MARASIARVEPLTRTRAVRGPFDYKLGDEQADLEVGALLRVPFGRRPVTGVVVALADRSEVEPERLVEPELVLPTSLPADLVELAGWMASEYCSTVSRALSLMLPPGAARKPRARPTPPRVGPSPIPHPELTRDQRVALDRVLEALGRRGDSRFLLHGVTGSGKTEVYLRAVAAALQSGRGAIVLVPEIALTPQVLGRFQERFGDLVAILHSGLRPTERRDQWRRLRSGQARVCVGPRSAVFAPIESLGLIVVDEEHDASYKHEGDPRYDARTVAERRAGQHGAVVLCGSATPRPESFARLERLRLPTRIDARPLPPVEVLDMRDLHHPLHPRTRLALADVRRSGGKAIVLLNRRGWSNFLSCRSCGRVWNCPNCEVALVLHRGSHAVVACHHCGHRETVPDSCPSCGSVAVARHGAGTQRLEHELTEALGGDEAFPVWRLDADITAAPDALNEVLTGFARASSGVLVGTQIVAKGHDFPDVTLGVVLDADQTLRFPDFRAEERTFSLLTQLAGRAGRGDAGGKVLVQTLAPDARPIRYAAGHDAEGFLQEELGHRRVLNYPPYGSLIRIVCAADQAPEATALAGELAERVRSSGATVLGPAPLFRLRGRARSQVVVKAQDRAVAVGAVGEAVDELAAQAVRKKVSISVDVDPQ